VPVGLQDSTYDGLTACNIANLSTCISQHLTSGGLNIPGGFAWLKFGCNGYGLGQVPPANVGGFAFMAAFVAYFPFRQIP
jgi:hypothetical protein